VQRLGERRIARLLAGAGAAWVCLAPATPAAAPQLVDVRVRLHPELTRVVFETDAAAPYRIVSIEEIAPDRFDLSVRLGADTQPLSVRGPRDEEPWVSVEPLRGGGSLARVRARGPVRVVEEVLERPPRVVLDLYEAARPALARGGSPPQPRAPADPAALPPVSAPAQGGGNGRGLWSLALALGLVLGASLALGFGWWRWGRGAARAAGSGPPGSGPAPRGRALPVSAQRALDRAVGRLAGADAAGSSPPPERTESRGNSENGSRAPTTPDSASRAPATPASGDPTPPRVEPEPPPRQAASPAPTPPHERPAAPPREPPAPPPEPDLLALLRRLDRRIGGLEGTLRRLEEGETRRRAAARAQAEELEAQRVALVRLRRSLPRVPPS